ncbi:MAG TPA: hypothetical protein ENJ08_17370 [Gammaproteobacteria bacterium]|nr:hypothetical protein [Gammaproteobacteria bacterium]
MTEATPTSQQVLLYPIQDNDEVNLIDLIKIIIKRKNIFYTIVLVCLLLGIVIVLIKPATYEYKSVLQIGKIEVKTKNGIEYELIEDVDSVQAKMENAYLTKVMSELKSQNPDAQIPEIKISIPKNSQVVLLQSKARADNKYVYQAQKSLAELLINDHKSVINKVLQGIDYDIKLKTIELDRLSNKKWQASARLNITNKVKKVEARQKEAKNQIELKKEELNNLVKIQKIKINQQAEINKQIIKFRALQLNFINSKNSETQALLSKAMINSEIQRLLDKETEIDLYLKAISNEKRQRIENEKKALELKLTELQNNKHKLQADLDKFELELENKIIKKKLEIEQLNIKKNNMQFTTLILELQNLDVPVGINKKLLVILSAFMGVFLGLIGVFVMEFASKVKEL